MEFVSRAHCVGVDFRCRRFDRFVPRGHVDDGDDFCGADVDDKRAFRFERVAGEGKVGIRRDTFSITKVVLLFLCGVYVIREDGKTFRFVVEKRIIQVPILAVRVDAHYDCYNLFAILGDYFEHI